MSEEQQEPRKRRKRGGWDEPPENIDPKLLAAMLPAASIPAAATIQAVAPIPTQVNGLLHDFLSL